MNFAPKMGSPPVSACWRRSGLSCRMSLAERTITSWQKGTSRLTPRDHTSAQAHVRRRAHGQAFLVRPAGVRRPARRRPSGLPRPGRAAQLVGQRGPATVAGLLGALLFGIVVQLSAHAMDMADDPPEPGPATSRHAIFVGEMAANTAYTSLVCVFAAIVFVVASIGTSWVLRVSSAVGLALAMHLVLVLMMVMKRVFALTQERLTRARTAGDQPADASRPRRHRDRPEPVLESAPGRAQLPAHPDTQRRHSSVYPGPHAPEG